MASINDVDASIGSNKYSKFVDEAEAEGEGEPDKEKEKEKEEEGKDFGFEEF